MFRVCHAFFSVHCSRLVSCWERANLLALLYEMFSCVFVTFPYGVLGQVWYLIVSIPDLCLLTYSDERNVAGNNFSSLSFLFHFTFLCRLAILNNATVFKHCLTLSFSLAHHQRKAKCFSSVFQCRCKCRNVADHSTGPSFELCDWSEKKVKN